MANRAYKGRRFEIRIADLLSAWWIGNNRERIFWHTHDSGGMATKRTQKGKTTKGLYGDLCAIDPRGQPLIDLITFELKNGYNHLSLQDLLDRPEGKKGKAGVNWHDWIAKAKETSKAAKTPHWVLIVQRDLREPLLVVPDDFFYKFFPDISGWAISGPGVMLRCELTDVWVFLLNRFLTSVSPHQIEKLLRQWRSLSQRSEGVLRCSGRHPS